MSYPWPLQPFDQQHPVRAFFGDPRIGKPLGGSSFHNGIDISAPNGTPVYAVAPGRVDLGTPQAVAVVLPGGGEHGYQHITPAVRQGEAVVQGQLLGHILPPGPGADWQHVHFLECTAGGTYWNPFREGALTPFAKTTVPSVDRIVAERGGTALDPHNLAGVVDLIAEAHDETPIPPLNPYQKAPVVPALVEWRLVADAGGVVPAWTTAADFRTSHALTTFIVSQIQADASAAYGVKAGATSDIGWENVYAPLTTQNNCMNPAAPNPILEPGLYRFKLASAFDTSAHPDGSYQIEVQVTDVRGNASTGKLAIVIGNGT